MRVTFPSRIFETAGPIVAGGGRPGQRRRRREENSSHMTPSKMPPPDTREILENPPENRPGTVRGDSEPLRIAPDCSGAILKHNLSQGRTTMEGRTTMR